MLNRKHQLEVGQTGIVGYVTGSGLPRIALDTEVDTTYFNNPDLPDTRSEMALPLTARGAIIGALDVQSTEAKAFSDNDQSVISLLADQIAIAIDNVRLIGETKNALEESKTLFSEYISESWQKKTVSGVLGYHLTANGGKVISDATAPELAMGNPVEEKALKIPIKVRDEVIGTLNIRESSKENNWRAEDINVVQAVAERLVLALDNARLFEETSSRASR